MTETQRARIDHSDVAEEINAAINYTMYAVFREKCQHSGGGSASASEETVRVLLQELDRVDGLVTRGWYDVSGFRADADVLIWWHAPTSGALQAAYRLVRERMADALEPVWSNIGVHRAAEFNRSHVPGFLAGEQAKDYLCVYPFVRGREWYLMPEDDRRRMLREHGAAARDYTDVVANTVASFALGDYEWLLAFEADDLTRIVDLMRELRAVEARRYVIEETPFFTGPRSDAEKMLRRALGVQ